MRRGASAQNQGARGPRPGSGPGRGLLTQGAGGRTCLGAVGATPHTQGAEQDGACGSGLAPLSRRELTLRRAKGIPPAPQ